MRKTFSTAWREGRTLAAHRGVGAREGALRGSAESGSVELVEGSVDRRTQLLLVCTKARVVPSTQSTAGPHDPIDRTSRRQTRGTGPAGCGVFARACARRRVQGSALSFSFCSSMYDSSRMTTCKAFQACCRRVAGVLQACCRRVAGVFQACCRRVAGVLQACCRRAPGCCACFVRRAPLHRCVGHRYACAMCMCVCVRCATAGRGAGQAAGTQARSPAHPRTGPMRMRAHESARACADAAASLSETKADRCAAGGMGRARREGRHVAGRGGARRPRGPGTCGGSAARPVCALRADAPSVQRVRGA